MKNYNIAAKKRGNDLIFLRKIVRGGADQSYGIEVAKLAGVPGWVGGPPADGTAPETPRKRGRRGKPRPPPPPPPQAEESSHSPGKAG